MKQPKSVELYKVSSMKIIQHLTILVTVVLLTAESDGSAISDPATQIDNSTVLHRFKRLGGSIATTVAGTTLKIVTKAAQLCKRSFIMIIDNHSSYPLTEPELFQNKGEIASPPIPVRPCLKEAIVGKNKKFPPRATSGMVSYKIKDLDIKVNILWKIPLRGPNLLGIEITKGSNQNPGNDLFMRIVKDENLTKKYSGGLITEKCSMYNNENIKVCGIMGTNDNPIIYVTVENHTMDQQRCNSKENQHH